MVKKVFITIFASLFIGVGINGFIIPIHLINGGLWGVSLILHYLLNSNIAITFACLNIPIFIFAAMYDKDYFLNGILGITISSIIVTLLAPIQYIINLPPLFSVLFGGIIIGIGVGFMLREHISPGGVDLLALMMSKILSINVGISLLILDSIIILFGVFILRDERLLYSMLIVINVSITAMLITSIKRIILFIK